MKKIPTVTELSYDEVSLEKVPENHSEHKLGETFDLEGELIDDEIWKTDGQIITMFEGDWTLSPINENANRSVNNFTSITDQMQSAVHESVNEIVDTTIKSLETFVNDVCDSVSNSFSGFWNTINDITENSTLPDKFGSDLCNRIEANRDSLRQRISHLHRLLSEISSVSEVSDRVVAEVVVEKPHTRSKGPVRDLPHVLDKAI